ncbi:MAG: diaminopimelate decarboxylase, partial [Prolixibacteraceae bacterium]|nr:diaminopimelate decarboxylase [Prolixibacteraceae bacterium]MBN2775244.1 diaminopimelate decarboxylase [Prolixibacteraceae bacterium]
NPEKNPVPDFKSYFKAFHNNLKLRKGQQLHFELGRSLVGQCGFFITRVLYLKKGFKTNFLIVDGGMNDLIRPMLYQAHHKYVSLTSALPEKEYTIAGPVCESTDVFDRNINLPESKRGDLIAVYSAGAYCQAMASTYNMRALVKAYDSDSV